MTASTMTTNPDQAASILRDLAPSTPLESLIVAQVVRAAEMLEISIEDGKSVSTGDRYVAAIRNAVETLGTIRREAARGAGSGGKADRPTISIPTTAGQRDIEEEDGPGDERADAPIWQDRLVLDFEVSDSSPVVKGTRVTVSNVVSMVVDGKVWAEILQTYPEITEDDIHACFAYALEELG